MGMVASYNETTDEYKYFGNLLDHQIVNQYYCSVKNILGHQKMEGSICLRNSDSKSDRIKNLLKMVIEQKDLVRKSLFKE